jgi:hypothetical protein
MVVTIANKSAFLASRGKKVPTGKSAIAELYLKEKNNEIKEKKRAAQKIIKDAEERARIAAELGLADGKEDVGLAEMRRMLREHKKKINRGSDQASKTEVEPYRGLTRF